MTMTVRQREPRQKSSRYLTFIRSLPCIACQRDPCGEAAHVRHNFDVGGERAFGKGEKPHDRRCVPLCGWCHRENNDSQHHIGELAFWTQRNINPILLAAALYSNRDSFEVAREIVLRSRGGLR